MKLSCRFLDIKWFFSLVWLLIPAKLPAQKTSGFYEAITSATRAQISLNGLWEFLPSARDTGIKDKNYWGLIRVPGAWATNNLWWTNTPGIVQKGRGKIWQNDLNLLTQAIYKKTILIPAFWKDKTVEIELERVSTDAVVIVNGNTAGTVAWYSGKINISRYLKYGQLNEIRLLVLATPEEGKIASLMGTAEEQVTFAKASLTTRGITGNVKLSCYPKGISIADIFVKTSVRRHEIAAEIELSQVKKTNKIEINAAVYDRAGKIVKRFTSSLLIRAAKSQTITIRSGWAYPDLWDLDNPNLYRLKVALKKDGKLIDEYIQQFGFREFWIAGKFFYLNGTRINLRPFTDVPGDGMHELIAAGITGLRKSGFNFSELWPGNYDVRGDIHDWHEIMSVADRKGYLLSGVVLPFSTYILDKSWSYQWDNPDIKQTWENRMVDELKKQRNHPSIILWGTSANFFGNAQDQNPLNIGEVNWIKNNSFWQRNAEAGKQAIKTIKSYDDTRPVFTHHGTYVGDVHTLNFYLNLIPLQEREEWLSNYAIHGKIPFMAVEFGTPLYCTFLRGRNGYGNVIKTEPLVTEYAAMYLGNRAYAEEPSKYRSLIADHFLGGQQYKTLDDPVVIENMPAFQDIQYLFTKNTWRSWRTWGIAGGMAPWSKGHGWVSTIEADKQQNLPLFSKNHTGNYFAKAPAKLINFLQPAAWKVLPGGKALIDNNNETLAYIAGSATSFTAKDHHFQAGDSVKKQLIFFNDTRSLQTCKWQVSVTINGAKLTGASGTVKIPAGEKRIEALNFKLPSKLGQFISDARILLLAKLAKNILKDTFNFRVFRPSKATTGKLYLYDPEGNTTKMFKTEGFDTRAWDGKSSVPLLVIGRNALLAKYQMPFNLEMFVKNGGKVLVMNQQPDSVPAKRGFRVSPYISRYVFPVTPNRGLFKGLDEKDFQNWNGASKLTEAYPDYMTKPIRKGASDIPYYGWHWGNNGGVATGALEKPHRTAWRPLMECEFDLAWSPLMELPYGNGLLIWNSLDLEDHFEQDVIARIMSIRLVDYLGEIKTHPQSQQTILIGTQKDAALVSDLGITYQKKEIIPDATDLLIVGDITPLQTESALLFARKGGKVLVLPRYTTGNFLGVGYKSDPCFAGAYHIPDWDIAEGLSVSDTRYRTNAPTIIIENGCLIEANGLLGKRIEGKGLIVFAQFDPDRFKADSLTYFRFTRWRQTRALSQVAANLGAAFDMDKAIFSLQNVQNNTVILDGNWKAQMTLPLPAGKELKDKYKDPGITQEALALMTANADESKMVEIPGNIEFEKTRNEWSNLDGEIVYRKTINIPTEMTGQDLTASLSVLDDYDQVYFNGVMIGKTGIEKEPVWSYSRTYTIPAKLVKPGSNVIAIRIFDTYGGGGLTPSTKTRKITTSVQPKINGLYHNNYLDDFQTGDDPFRYFRW